MCINKGLFLLFVFFNSYILAFQEKVDLKYSIRPIVVFELAGPGAHRTSEADWLASPTLLVSQSDIDRGFVELDYTLSKILTNMPGRIETRALSTPIGFQPPSLQYHDIGSKQGAIDIDPSGFLLLGKVLPNGKKNGLLGGYASVVCRFPLESDLAPGEYTFQVQFVFE